MTLPALHTARARILRLSLVPPSHGWSTHLLLAAVNVKTILWLGLSPEATISPLGTRILPLIQGADALLVLFRTSVPMRA